MKPYLAIIWVTEHYVDTHESTTWSAIWRRFFDTEEEANDFVEYHQREFGHRATIYKNRKLIKDTRY